MYEVTIGIPVYKSEPFIRRALMSALSQSFSSIEFLIIDDGGDDGSMEIIHEMMNTHPKGRNIRIITHKNNMGVSASRNHIIQEAKGNFLYFMDSDDVIEENTIEMLVRNARQYNAEIVFGSYERIGVTGNRMVFQYPFLHFSGKDQLASFAYRKYGGIQASSCNYLVRLSLLRDNHLRFIDTDYWEDMAFTFNLVTYITKAVLLPDITYSYYCRENSLSNYQERASVPKQEILRNVNAVEYLKQTTPIYINKVYYPNRCYLIALTEFYVVCNILKRRNTILPTFSAREIKSIMSHPATFLQICHFRQWRCKNFALFFLGKMPQYLCVVTIWCIAKMKKLA